MGVTGSDRRDTDEEQLGKTEGGTKRGEKQMENAKIKTGGMKQARD